MENGVNPQEVTFIYRDAKGNISARTVADISETEDYLQGICLSSNGLRTFRKDRILEKFPDQSSAEARVSYHASNSPPPKPTPKSHHLLDICFTGFKSNDKERLVTLAETTGLTVRDSVTRNLNFLCGGYNAGPAKIEKARKQGVVFLSEEQFVHLVETGELPES